MSKYSLASDEEILVASRFGDVSARKELDKRYLLVSKASVVRTVPGLLAYVSIDELMPLGTQIYLKCIDGFKPGRGRFKTYYETALRRALWNYRDKKIKSGFGPLSFDDSIPASGNLTLHDVLGSRSLGDNPRMYLDYFDEVDSLGLGRRAITKEVKKIASLHLDGLSFSEIGKRMGLSTRVAFLRFQTYKEEVAKLIQRPDDNKA
jgi:hypothetical protein